MFAVNTRQGKFEIDKQRTWMWRSRFENEGWWSSEHWIVEGTIEELSRSNFNDKHAEAFSLFMKKIRFAMDEEEQEAGNWQKDIVSI